MFTFTDLQIGVVASAVSALFSLWPVLGATDGRRALVSFLALIIGVFAFNGFEFTTWAAFAMDLAKAGVVSLLTYKAILQPVFQTVADNTRTPVLAAYRKG